MGHFILREFVYPGRRSTVNQRSQNIGDQGGDSFSAECYNKDLFGFHPKNVT